MTPTRYLIVRAAQAFGYFRRNQRMSDAASEMHLLREAEAYLGSTIWENVENIEALSVEYWNLRKLVKERNHVRQRLAACQENLALAHEERVSLLKSTPEFDQQLLDHRQDLLNELEHLSKQRDDIVAQAREVRRTFVGLKMKLEVLAKESTDSSSTKEETDKVKARLLELKNQFEQLKHERITVGTHRYQNAPTLRRDRPLCQPPCQTRSHLRRRLSQIPQPRRCDARTAPLNRPQPPPCRHRLKSLSSC